MAHALHPNYADKHDPDLAPRLGAGLVLKHNVNQRYATTSISATLFRWGCGWVVWGWAGVGFGGVDEVDEKLRGSFSLSSVNATV